MSNAELENSIVRDFAWTAEHFTGGEDTVINADDLPEIINRVLEHCEKVYKPQWVKFGADNQHAKTIAECKEAVDGDRDRTGFIVYGSQQDAFNAGIDAALEALDNLPIPLDAATRTTNQAGVR